LADGLAEPAGSSPAFATLARLLTQLPAKLPDVEDLNRLFAGRVINDQGEPLRCVPPSPLDDDGYEARVLRRGELAVRPDNWHDVFNALVWLAFPKTKRVINALHVAHMETTGAAAPGQRSKNNIRGTARDVLTMFDEDGILVASAAPELATLLTNFQWKQLFWERREQVKAHMDFHIFGHALYDKMRNPFFGLTAKALIIPVAPSYFALSMDDRLAELDSAVSVLLRNSKTLSSTSSLAPLPLLGIPGWWTENERPGYYDDQRQFRPRRALAALRSGSGPRRPAVAEGVK